MATFAVVDDKKMTNVTENAETNINKSEHHPLHAPWTLWYDSKKTQKEGVSWEENLQNVGVIRTVEEFWATYGYIKQPSALEIGSSYHFFKNGIKPMWEDPKNKVGGKYVLSLSTGQDLFRLDTVWQELMMAMIGEYLEEGSYMNDLTEGEEQVTGCVLSKRKNMARVSVWVTTCTGLKDDKKKEKQSSSAAETDGRGIFGAGTGGGNSSNSSSQPFGKLSAADLGDNGKVLLTIGQRIKDIAGVSATLEFFPHEAAEGFTVYDPLLQL